MALHAASRLGQRRLAGASDRRSHAKPARAAGRGRRIRDRWADHAAGEGADRGNGVIFGPLRGFIYALIGETLAAVTTYFLGRKLGRATVRRVAGKRINELSRRIAKRGLIAVVLVRALPVAPFTIINLIAGASHISFRDFLLGTIIGMAPGTLVLVVFVDRIVAAVRDPGPLSFALLALIAGIALGGAMMLRARLGSASPGQPPPPARANG